MGSVIVLLSLILSLLLLASYRQIDRKNREMLDRYIEMFSLEEKPTGEKQPKEEPAGNDPPGDMPPDFQLSTFYAVVFDDDGEVLYVDEGRRLYGRQELIDLTFKLVKENKESGKSGNLKYRIVQRQGYTLAAFIDVTLVQSDIRAVFDNVLIIGMTAVFVMFFLSVFLSDRIIRPLEDNDRRQKQFISDASHELKTPVAVIDANAELLSRQVKENEWLANIRHENKRMGELVNQLLLLSKADSGEKQMKQLDLSRIVTKEVLVFESLAFEQGKTFTCDIGEGIIIEGDQIQLEQLVSILVDNAIQHSKGKEIFVSLKKNGQYALLKVRNEADEIPPETLEHLFDRFYRIDQVRNGEDHHYGLGLAIAKTIVSNHAGEVDVSAGEGKIEFSIKLPVR